MQKYACNSLPSTFNDLNQFLKSIHTTQEMGVTIWTDLKSLSIKKLKETLKLLYLKEYY